MFDILEKRSDSEVEECQIALEKLAGFLEIHSDITNVCMVDFITDNVYEKSLSPEIGDELLNLTEDQIRNLPQRLVTIFDEKKSSDENSLSFPNLEKLLKQISSLSIDNLESNLTIEDLVNNEKNILENFDRIMGEKKTHEVVILSDVINRVSLSFSHNSRFLVDIGSGKCYLSQMLSKIFDFQILAIDASEGNRNGAEKRVKNLQNKWDGLKLRAEIRNSGKIPPKRGKNWKAKSNLETNWKEENEIEKSWEKSNLEPDLNSKEENEIEKSWEKSNLEQDLNLKEENEIKKSCEKSNLEPNSNSKEENEIEKSWDKLNLEPDSNSKEENEIEKSWEKSNLEPDSNSKKENEIEKSWEKSNLEPNSNSKEENEIKKSSSSEKKNLMIVTQFVDEKTNLIELLRENFEGNSISDEIETFGIVGLHTCGNLAPDSMRIFLANPKAKFLVNVGCCYHHLNEEFYRHPFKTELENDSVNSESRFPMSNLLRKRKFQLGRNSRMMAAQPTNRMAEHNELPSLSLFWRALLQVLLRRHFPSLPMSEQQVGKIASRAKGDFAIYCELAFQKLGLQNEIRISREELLSFHDEYSVKFLKKLQSFYQLRSLFSSLVEGLIVLDRKLFLLEQDDEIIRAAKIVKLFNPIISPRCYAIIASKQK